jgi:hypothetical protein
MLAANVFAVPKQGSAPKVATLTASEHALRPTHAAVSTAVEFAESQVPLRSAPHAPEGVPKEAKSTPENACAGGQVKKAVCPSPTPAWQGIAAKATGVIERGANTATRSMAGISWELMRGGVGGSLASMAGAHGGAPAGGTNPGAAHPGCSFVAS